ncbi:MAG TPA: I78 family peptidase inhibitor [Ramlibacter sp.]|nr:I78 family peptidase inhibitor [Ramlibacter sp.]
MQVPRLSLLLGLTFSATLAGCATAPPPSGGPAPAPPTVVACEAGPAQSVVGQVATASVVEDARQRAGARSARVLRPGQVVTMEFDATRLNLDVDAQGRVVRVRCG